MIMIITEKIIKKIFEDESTAAGDLLTTSTTLFGFIYKNNALIKLK